MRGQHNDGCVGKFLADDAGRLSTVHAGQVQIHEDDVRTVFPELLDGQQAGGDLYFDAHIRLDVD